MCPSLPDGVRHTNLEKTLLSYLPWVERFFGLLLIGLCFGDLASRYAFFYGRPLNPDVPTFLSGATEMRFFWDSGLREPMQVFFFRIGFLFSDDPEQIARVVTTIQTLILAGVFWMLARAVLGRLFGLIALLLFATNPIVLHYGPSGMRAPLYTTLLLMFTMGLFRQFPPSSWHKKMFLIGSIGGALILTRALAFPIFIGGLFVYFLYKRAWKHPSRTEILRLTTVSFLVACLYYLPHYFLRESSISNNATEYFRNLERTGRAFYTPGGSDITIFQWLFDEHSLTWVIKVLFENTLLYLTDYLPFFFRGYEALAWLVPFAMLLSIRTNRWSISMMLLLVLGPVIFILHFSPQPGVQGVENRFVYPAFPFALILMLHVFSETVGNAVKRFKISNSNLAQLCKYFMEPLSESRDKPKDSV
jgi:4-amino-4-deoxy-L-arabinose transferase-like glycosyltransferase